MFFQNSFSSTIKIAPPTEPEPKPFLKEPESYQTCAIGWRSDTARRLASAAIGSAYSMLTRLRRGSASIGSLTIPLFDANLRYFYYKKYVEIESTKFS